MRITRIEVDRLFNRFNHVIPLTENEPITIVIGPNGFGKTTILRMINAVFNQPMRTLARIPFGELRVHFDNGGELRAVRVSGEKARAANIELTYTVGGQRHNFRSEPISREIDFPISAIDRFVPELDRSGPEEWRNMRTGEFLSLDEVLDRYWEIFPTSENRPGVPDWLKELRNSLHVRFIDTERLTQPSAPESRHGRVAPHRQPPPARTVRRYAEELAELVKKTLADYGELSQSLDRTFPARLVEQPSELRIPRDQLRSELAQVEDRRKQLIDAGLLREDHRVYWHVQVPDLDRVEQSRQSVLAVYASDAREKLNVFNHLYNRVAALTSIANSRLLHKRVTVGPSGLTVVTPEGHELDLESLSSGEQHELVLLYELLFKVEANALILIDEPELSLHVAWQEEILSDLTKVAVLSGFQVVLATHSPQIIGDRWDLTVELKAPNGR